MKLTINARHVGHMVNAETIDGSVVMNARVQRKDVPGGAVDDRSATADGAARGTTVLFLAANPSDTTRLAIDREMREVTRIVRECPMREAIEVKYEGAVRLPDLDACLIRHRPTIVHFSGHGLSTGALILDDDRNRSAEVADVSRLLSVLKDRVRCVVLNACFSDTHAMKIVQHIDCVIGMQSSVSDDSAIDFSSGFYQSLCNGESIQKAFDVGCARVNLRMRPGAADVPRLLVRDGLDPTGIVLVKRAR